MHGIFGIHPGWGITAVRIAMAIVLIQAGWAKWFTFGVSTGVTTTFGKYGLPAPAAFAYAAATLELAGGIALLVGLLGRWLGLLYAIEFAIAAFYVKFRLQGFIDGRLELMLMAGGILLVLAGPGKAALDAFWPEKESDAAVRRRAA